MKQLYLLLVTALLVMTSCTKYSISGSSELQNVDGRMLYLKYLPIAEDNPVSIDSCDVVHGKFKFSGALDSVRVVVLCLDNNPIVPVVLEDGEVSVNLNDQYMSCKGTALNDSLTALRVRLKQLEAQAADKVKAINDNFYKAYTQGEVDENTKTQVEIEEQKVNMEYNMAQEQICTSFIERNFDNCLGSYVFQMLTPYERPIMEPWIEALLIKATETFKNDPYVSYYVETARRNERDEINGMLNNSKASMPAVTPNPNMNPQLGGTPPTPAEMATSEN